MSEAVPNLPEIFRAATGYIVRLGERQLFFIAADGATCVCYLCAVGNVAGLAIRGGTNVAMHLKAMHTHEFVAIRRHDCTVEPVDQAQHRVPLVVVREGNEVALAPDFSAYWAKVTRGQTAPIYGVDMERLRRNASKRTRRFREIEVSIPEDGIAWRKKLYHYWNVMAAITGLVLGVQFMHGFPNAGLSALALCGGIVCMWNSNRLGREIRTGRMKTEVEEIEEER